MNIRSILFNVVKNKFFSSLIWLLANLTHINLKALWLSILKLDDVVICQLRRLSGFKLFTEVREVTLD